MKHQPPQQPFLNEDEVLRRLLQTPPQPHKAKPAPAKKAATKRRAKKA
jgi:hypothetical protein